MTLDRLRHARTRLLALHQVLLDLERQDYERDHGRLSARAFLDAVMRDPAFAWLAPMTTLMVCIDETLAQADDAPLVSPAACLAQARELLQPGDGGNAFQIRYAQALQRSADLVVAHGAVMQSLREP